MGEKKRLWITRRLSDKTLERAEQYYDCEINFEDRVYSQDELIGLLSLYIQPSSQDAEDQVQSEQK